MNELTVFNNHEFGEIRTIEEDGRVLFCGSDVAKALRYKNPTKAIADHCKGTVERRTNDSLGRQQNMKFIPEGDVYRLIVNSKLPSAERFERWVFDEVLPSIRKHGMYATTETVENMLADHDTAIRLLNEIKAEREKRAELEAEREANRPKVIFADSVAASKTSILVGELAKLLKQNGVPVGQNRLFGWMRENGFLIRRKGSDFNMPTQRAMEMGLFEIKETSITHADGHTSINKTPKVTGKGQQYFVNALIAKNKKSVV